MQLCKPLVSQYGTHLPSIHLPFSWHSIPFRTGGLGGQFACHPVHSDCSSQVLYWAFLHTAPRKEYRQPWQQGEFLSLRKSSRLLRCGRGFHYSRSSGSVQTGNAQIIHQSVFNRVLKVVAHFALTLSSWKICCIPTNCSCTKFAIFVAATVCIFCSEQTSVALFTFLDFGVSAKAFFWSGKAYLRFRFQHFSYRTYTARGKCLEKMITKRHAWFFAKLRGWHKFRLSHAPLEYLLTLLFLSYPVTE